MMRKLILTLLLAALVTACTSTGSEKVVSLQKRDKALSCKEIMLEQNEAEFYRKTAEKNKGPSLKSVVMPLGYISTYVSAENAIEASNSRMEYLNRIYEILDCDNPASEANNRARMSQGMGTPAGYSGGYGATSSQQPYFGAQSAGFYNQETSTVDGEWYW